MHAVAQLQRIKHDAETIKNDETQYFPEAAVDGDSFRQGDIYITFRNGHRGKSCAVSLQLAPGTTQGSRHVLDSSEGVKMYQLGKRDALQGPILVLTEQRTVTHPEHGDVVLPARGDGCYEITYQRAYAEELRRVDD